MTLSFRIGKIPVRVHPVFFLMTVILGSGDFHSLPVWVGVVFVSVLIHELGHATAGLAFGLAPQIDLHGMGGTTSWPGGKRVGSWRHIVISLAGPCAGFVFYGAALAYSTRFPPTSDVAVDVLDKLRWVNLGWGVVNLVPMLPLDGGNVMTQLLNAATRGRGERPARIVSIVFAAAAFVLTVMTKQWWLAFLAGSFASSNWRGLRDISAREHDAPMRPVLEQAYAALNAKDGARVLELARPIALESRTAPVRAEALQLMAFGFLLQGRVADADAALAAMPEGFQPHPSLVQLRAAARV
jgi:Zn-dependent protease